MRLASALAMLTFASPALAAGLPSSPLSPSWTALPTTHFSSWDRAPVGRVLPVHAAAISNAAVTDAFASVADVAAHRDLAIAEIAQGWDRARRTALEDLRDAQRAYASAAGGDSEMRGQRFFALLKQVVDNSGRSAAVDPPSGSEAALSQIYDRVIRDTPDDRLSAIETSETAWIAYRDAFDHFALAMDRPDAAKLVRDDLVRHRAEELEANIAK